jgi:NAD+ kinase
MRLALYGRLTASTDYPTLEHFLRFLRQKDIAYALFVEYAAELALTQAFREHTDLLSPTFATADDLGNGYDFLYSLGGDGTLLDAVRMAGLHRLPVVGINLGRLGFLAGTDQNDLVSATESLLLGQYRLDTRAMIRLDARPELPFSAFPYGLNEVTIHKANSNEMIVLHTFVNGEFLNTYWCDGLIVSTPTGSTAYSLACGGPIIMPSAGVFVLTPIAPHSLTVRPFILPDDAVVTFEIESRSGQALVAIDSRTELVPTTNAEIAIRKAPIQATLVKVNAPSYFGTLRARLNWGRDVRN